jgi:hypothetical protein
MFSKQSFIFCLYLSFRGNAGEIEDSAVQLGSRAPVKASPDMFIEAKFYV